MSSNDDWGAEDKDWGSSEGNSDFDFKWDPEGNFQHVSSPKRSPLEFVSQQSIWLKIVSGVVLAAVVLFTVVQTGGVTKLQSMGVFRQSLSPEAMCLNGGQVAAELAVGVLSPIVMNRTLDHAARVKSQRSGDAAIDEAAWAVADAAYLVNEAVESIPQAISSADMMLGDMLDAFNSEESRAAALAVSDATMQLGKACGALADTGASNSQLGASEQSPSQVSESGMESAATGGEPTLLDETQTSDDEIVEPGSEISFLTFNVCNSDCKDPAPSWDIRRSRIANVIADSKVDVVGLQEVTNWRVNGSTTQWSDIKRLVATAGFQGPKISDEFNNCSGTNSEPCVDTARILFNSQAVVQMESVQNLPAAGYTRLGVIAPGIDVNARNRTVAWAYFKAAKGDPFLAISMHMDSDRTNLAEDARQAVAGELNLWAENLNKEVGIEAKATVLMADLNSYDARQPAGAQSILRQQGWTDSWSAADRKNIYFSTINLTPDTQNYGGWPPRPRPFNNAATRIDYIFAWGDFQLVDYEVMLWLNSDGTFDHEYQASDHQSVRATLIV